MKRILKLICTLLVFCMIAGVLSGCHGGKLETPADSEKKEEKEKPTFTVPEAFDTSKQHEIVFWAKNDTNKTQTNIYKKAIEDFAALYPNIKIKYKPYTDYGRIYSDVITNIPTKTTPDVCITYPDHIATYITGEDTVVPLDDLLVNEKYGLGGSELQFTSPKKDEVIERYLNEGYIDGTSYALPFMRSTEACYINKTFVEKLGYTLPETLTWDFVWEVSEKAMEKNSDGTFKVNGQNVMIPFIYKATDNMAITMLKQKNADYSTDDGKILVFNDTTKGILDEIAPHAKSGAFSTFKISSYPGNYLNAGQCIFAIDSTAGATWMGSSAPSMDISRENVVDFETVVMAVPQYDPANPRMMSQGPSLCIFRKDDPQRVLASWLFMQYLLTNDVQIAYAQTEGYIPVTTLARESAEYKDYLSRSGEDNALYYKVKLDATNLLLSNIENTFVTPVFNGSASLRDAAQQLVERVTKSGKNKETIDSAYYDNLFDTVISQFHLTVEK